MTGSTQRAMLAALAQLGTSEDDILVVVPDGTHPYHARELRRSAHRLAAQGKARAIFRRNTTEGARHTVRLCLARIDGNARSDAWRKNAPSCVEPPPLSTATISIRLLATLTAELTGTHVPVKKAFQALQELERQDRRTA